MKTYATFFVTCSLLAAMLCQGQDVLREKLKEVRGLQFPGAVSTFYTLAGNRQVWITNAALKQQLLELLATSEQLALEKKDYQQAFISELQKGKILSTADDSLIADIRLTDAALHFFSDLEAGNRKPPLRYEGLKYNPGISHIPKLLLQEINRGRLGTLTQTLQPDAPGYQEMLRKLNWFQQLKRTPGFKETRISSSKVSPANGPLLARLYQLGISDTIKVAVTEKELSKAVREAQDLFNLMPDGTLKSPTLKALNRPLVLRIAELKIAINQHRWLKQLKRSGRVAILNIPAAWLDVYEKDRLLMQSKVVVGKRSTPTPSLSSTITQVILYPYWQVPGSIATKELLPAIKKNIGYLEANNYQVLNKEGRVINPYSVNWSALGPGNFPYAIRQSTGCDNSLGVVKFNFYNPFTVYLHDTPSKGLFALNKRYFSHGCMRLENFLDLGKLLVGDNREAIELLRQQECLINKPPQTLKAVPPLPIVILYSPAWLNEKGRLVFYDDIYNRIRA